MIPNRNIWLIATILATAIISATVSDVLGKSPLKINFQKENSSLSI